MPRKIRNKKIRKKTLKRAKPVLKAAKKFGYFIGKATVAGKRGTKKVAEKTGKVIKTTGKTISKKGKEVVRTTSEISKIMPKVVKEIRKGVKTGMEKKGKKRKK